MMPFKTVKLLVEVHQALLSQFSLLTDFNCKRASQRLRWKSSKLGESHSSWATV
jgi:hypothetical protein